MNFSDWALDAKPGDFLVIYNMPFPLASALISLVSKGQHCDHCAMVLPSLTSEYVDDLLIGTTDWHNLSGPPPPCVYEAQPPVVRKLSIPDYARQLSTWANKKRPWRLRSNRLLYVESYRPTTPLSSQTLVAMAMEADQWLGVRYRMVLNWLLAGPSIHCSELAARLLQSAKLAFWPQEPSRVKPVDVRNALQTSEWFASSYQV